MDRKNSVMKLLTGKNDAPEAEKPAAKAKKPAAKKTVAKLPTEDEVDAEIAAAEAAEPPVSMVPDPVMELPTTKAQLAKLSELQIDELQAEHGWEVSNWDQLPLVEKKAEATKILFPTAKATKTAKASVPSDPMTVLVAEIESLADQAQVEKRIHAVLEEEGLNDFRLGGLLQKLQEVGAFAEAVSFKDHVITTFGVEYRKARYLITNYNGLLNAGVEWAAVKDVGWTKLNVLIPVLTSENVAEWVEKALSVNKETLKEMVKAALAAGDGQATPDLVSNFSTKTFKLASDQLEIVEEAVKDAMEQGKTEHPGTGLYYICTQFLAASMGENPSKQTAILKELAEAKAQIAALKEQLSEAEASADVAAMTGPPDPKSFFTAMLQVHGSQEAAAEVMFTDGSFDKVFPDINIKVSLPES